MTASRLDRQQAALDEAEKRLTAAVARLTEIFRQAAESRIVVGAHRIRDGHLPDLTNPPGTDLFFFDAKDPEDQVGDPETHFKTKEQPTLFFSGPFAREVSTSGPLLLPDIERMNLFRRAEIHCVAIGEAPDGLLRAIADVGRGKFRRAGGDAPPDTAQPPK